MKVGAIAVAISTIILMFYSGMLFEPASIRQQFSTKNLRRFGRLIVLNYVVIPLLTLGLIWMCAFPSVLNLVLLTMAMLPCASMVPPLVSMTGEPPEWALFVFLGMSIFNLAVVPLLMALLSLSWVAGGDQPLGSGNNDALLRYVIAVYGPMSLGAAIRIFSPRYAPGLLLFLRRILMPLMLFSFCLFIFSYREEMLSLKLRELGVYFVFEFICIVAGLAFEMRNARDGNPPSRVSTVLICSLRNVSMGIVFCVIVFPHTAAPSYMMAFTNLMFLGMGLWLCVNRWTTRDMKISEDTD